MNKFSNSSHPLTPAARAVWLDVTASNLRERFIRKYQEGQREHGGDLGAVSIASLVQEAQSEVLDQAAYLAEINRRVNDYDHAVVELTKVIAGLRQGKRLTEQHRTMVLKLNTLLNMEDYQYESEATA